MLPGCGHGHRPCTAAGGLPACAAAYMAGDAATTFHIAPGAGAVDVGHPVAADQLVQLLERVIPYRPARRRDQGYEDLRRRYVGEGWDTLHGGGGGADGEQQQEAGGQGVGAPPEE
eukprot:SAG31_NODE_26798_length_436_cov_1.219585_1_plen_115_part_10